MYHPERALGVKADLNLSIISIIYRRIKGLIAKSVSVKPEVLNEFLNSIVDKKGNIKTQSLIVLLKGFGLYKGNNDAERVLKSLCPKNDGLIPKNVLQAFFQNEIRYERGKLSE